MGIADPCRPGGLLTTVEGRDFAAAASGGAERGRHVLDPRTGRAAHRLLAATVTGPDLTRADSRATAAVALGPDARTWITSRPGYELLTVDLDGRARRSGGFPLTGSAQSTGRRDGAPRALRRQPRPASALKRRPRFRAGSARPRRLRRPGRAVSRRGSTPRPAPARSG
ncbi:FAD:protein FMN transferase [Streptomyces sp. AB3(2024)]|uniref:FAD:protein FMN transferase n=1 Tax=Streptomyces sp. AB3(2024) TaxID=3317321 RepID=UPI0035A309A7